MNKQNKMWIHSIYSRAVTHVVFIILVGVLFSVWMFVGRFHQHNSRATVQDLLQVLHSCSVDFNGYFHFEYVALAFMDNFLFLNLITQFFKMFSDKTLQLLFCIP